MLEKILSSDLFEGRHAISDPALGGAAAPKYQNIIDRKKNHAAGANFVGLFLRKLSLNPP